MRSLSVSVRGTPLTCAAVAAVLVCSGSAHAQALETLVHFQCSTLGCAPNGVLLQARDGFFYGTTSESDFASGGHGTVFRMDRHGGIDVLPAAAAFFFEGADGAFYGTTGEGGAFGAGTVFRMDASGVVTDLFTFDGTAFAGPGPIVQAHDGSLYGTVGIVGTDDMGLFRVGRQQELEVRRVRGDLVSNVRTLVHARNRSLYGTTYTGLVFRMNRNGQTRVLHAFPTVYLDLMEASDNLFYGASIDGGASGAGMIFRMTRAGKVTVLHSFGGAAGDGAFPYEAPIEGRDGYLYGTTGGGGQYGQGTVYRMDRAGRVTVLHSFGESEQAGANPVGDLVQGDDGALYGTTVNGGVWGHGTAFRLRID